jgi:hypothetical protein
MGSLFQNMSKGSYGIVPGKGNPRADDLDMNAGPGHVVPAENAGVAKNIVKTLGYNPNEKVSLNQGKGRGQDIKISSKEYFLNDEITERMKNELGIDPETLSPNSPYNERVDGGTTKQVKDMVNGKLNMYDLMMNNNNQNPAYQNGGGTGGGFPREFQSALHRNVYGDATPTQETVSAIAGMAQKEWPGYLAGTGNYGHIEMSPEVMAQWDPATGQPISSGAPGADPGVTEQRPYSGIPGTYTSENFGDFDFSGIPAFEGNEAYQTSVRSQVESGGWGLDVNDPENPYTYKIGSERDPNFMPKLPTKPVEPLPDDIFTNPDNYPGGKFPEGHDMYVDPESNVDTGGGGQDPYDKAMDDLLQRSKDLTRNEKAAQIGMGLWNMTRDYQPLPEPVYVAPSLVRRDYEGMKTEAIGDIERSERRNQYMMREMGIDPLKSGVAAGMNTQQQTREINRTIFDMQQADLMHNVQVENASKSDYANKKYHRDMTDAKDRAAFTSEKGQKMADNVREYMGAEEAGLYRDSQLEGQKANQELASLDADYDALDKQKMYDAQDWLSRKAFTELSEEERAQKSRLYQRGTKLV